MTTPLLTILTVHLLAVASPGPDFALVTHRSMTHGRRAGVLAAAGSTTGLIAHLALAMLGLGAVLTAMPTLAKGISLAGAAYLSWMAWGCLTSKGAPAGPAADTARRNDFTAGIFTNILNPKVALYCMGLFSQVISPDMSIRDGLIMTGAILALTMTWFTSIALLFSTERMLNLVEKYRIHFDRTMGAALAVFAVLLIVRAF